MSDTRPRKAVFLDKDGTLMVDVPFNVDPGRIAWRDGAFEALKALRDAGYELVMVTNQSGIARGYFGVREFERYIADACAQLEAHGVQLAAVEFCPHHPDSRIPQFRRTCVCRKPNPGMLVRAAAQLGFDLTRSWMVGDLLDDVEAGARAGCRTALVYHDGNEQVPPAGLRRPDEWAEDLPHAVERILARTEAVA